ncbi:MAG: metallophosphoesterase [Gammaproteobacteria bacterium]|nr:MAG: metallophosphoesterase [Gammaproteobacteria bacterium]
MYDLIGDIHGELGALEALLRKLGYRRTSEGWSHPGRMAIFLGDFIDRGADSRGVCRLVREMTQGGSAKAVMGNHEFNALAYHTPDPLRPGAFLREHSPKNRSQHEATLESFAGNDAEFEETRDWFASLPLWLDLGGLRVVHAAWHTESMEALHDHLDTDRKLQASALEQMSRKEKTASRTGKTAYESVETVLKGVEVKLPDGCRFVDKDGHQRHEARIRWWLREGSLTWRELALGPPELIAQLPDALVNEGASRGYPADAPPVFIGHYWLTGKPAPLAPNVACLDYSVAKPGGQLVAYRWEGEQILKVSSFVSVSR